MEPIRIKFAGLWIVVMFVYQLGDILRLYAGDFTPGEIDGQALTQVMLLLMAGMMLLPILMIYFSLVLPHPAIRWVHIGVAVFFLLLNLVGLPTYPGRYDQFLLVVSMVFNGITIWEAWKWV